MRKLFGLSSGELALMLAFSALVSVLIFNAFYAHPMADDYCYTDSAIGLGSWFAAVAHEYNNWGGRYAATALMSIFAINLDRTAPIFKVAHYGIVGDLYQILPQLIAKIKEGGAATCPIIK